MKYNLKFIGEPVLRQKSENIQDFNEEIKKITNEMFEIMYMGKGVGLSAPQIGLNKNIIIVDQASCGVKKKPYIIINTKIIKYSNDTITMQEGCLSLPYFGWKIKRSKSILIEYKNLKGNTQKEVFTNLLSQAIQHEYDHLNGKLIIDYMNKKEIKKVINKLQQRNINTELYNNLIVDNLV